MGVSATWRDHLAIWARMEATAALTLALMKVKPTAEVACGATCGGSLSRRTYFEASTAVSSEASSIGVWKSGATLSLVR